LQKRKGSTGQCQGCRCMVVACGWDVCCECKGGTDKQLPAGTGSAVPWLWTWGLVAADALAGGAGAGVIIWRLQHSTARGAAHLHPRGLQHLVGTPQTLCSRPSPGRWGTWKAPAPAPPEQLLSMEALCKQTAEADGAAAYRGEESAIIADDMVQAGALQEAACILLYEGAAVRGPLPCTHGSHSSYILGDVVKSLRHKRPNSVHARVRSEQRSQVTWAYPVAVIRLLCCWHAYCDIVPSVPVAARVFPKAIRGCLGRLVPHTYLERHMPHMARF
jgi:hypothetical protein